MTFQSKKSFFIRFSILFFWGALWHFLYSWSGNNILVGMIAPVNESVFEHLKLLFFPCRGVFIDKTRSNWYDKRIEKIFMKKMMIKNKFERGIFQMEGFVKRQHKISYRKVW